MQQLCGLQSDRRVSRRATMCRRFSGQDLRHYVGKGVGTREENEGELFNH
jgi:hypothetical protein